MHRQRGKVEKSGAVNLSAGLCLDTLSCAQNSTRDLQIASPLMLPKKLIRPVWGFCKQ